MVLRGECHGRAKLNQQAVAELKNLRATTGAIYAELGSRFGVNATTAHRAITGRRWRNSEAAHSI